MSCLNELKNVLTPYYKYSSDWFLTFAKVIVHWGKNMRLQNLIKEFKGFCDKSLRYKKYLSAFVVSSFEFLKSSCPQSLFTQSSAQTFKWFPLVTPRGIRLVTEQRKKFVAVVVLDSAPAAAKPTISKSNVNVKHWKYNLSHHQGDCTVLCKSLETLIISLSFY